MEACTRAAAPGYPRSWPRMWLIEGLALGRWSYHTGMVTWSRGGRDYVSLSVLLVLRQARQLRVHSNSKLDFLLLPST